MYVGIQGFDLTDFITNCTKSVYCDNKFYDYRYDGLAVGHYMNGDFYAP